MRAGVRWMQRGVPEPETGMLTGCPCIEVIQTIVLVQMTWAAHKSDSACMEI